MAELSSAQVSDLLKNPKWAEYTDIRNWHVGALMILLAQDSEEDASAFVSTMHNMNLHPMPNDIKDGPLPAPGDSVGALGSLQRLPLEIIWKILERMDIGTFLSLAGTSRQARTLCKQHSAFKTTAEYMAEMWLTLKGVGLHKWISVGALCEEIQQPKCRSCGENGHLFFMATSERICGNCLVSNPAYWCIPLYDAKMAFALEDGDFRRLPVFRDPQLGYQQSGSFLQLTGRELFVPIKSALKSAIEAHGSRDAMRAAAERDAFDRFIDRTTEEEIRGFLHRYWRNIFLGKLPGDPSQVIDVHKDLIKAQSLYDVDIRKCATFLPFRPHRAEKPVKLYKCKGCASIVDQFVILPEHMKYMGDADLGVTHSGYLRMLKGRARKVHTWGELREHIPKCLGSGLKMWKIASIMGRSGH